MNKIFDCQQHIADLLNADPFFNDPDPTKKIEAITQRKGNIALAVQQGLQKLGVGVIVMLPLMTFDGLGSRISLGLRFAIIVTENPLSNQSATGSGKPAETIVEKICQLVHWKPNGVNLSQRSEPGLYKLDRNAVRIMEPVRGNEFLLNYTVAVNTTITL
jgi:hypothetical protein